jgi:hypothetical protein
MSDKFWAVTNSKGSYAKVRAPDYDSALVRAAGIGFKVSEIESVVLVGDAPPIKKNNMSAARQALKKKRRAKNPAVRSKKKATKKRVKTARKKNPAPLLYIITAQGSGKKMHYDGAKFSERARVKTFATKDAAYKKACELVDSYPILKRYRIAIEDNKFPKR